MSWRVPAMRAIPQDSSLDLTSAAMALERLLDRILRHTTGAPVGLVAVGPEQWGVEQLTPGWYDGTTGVAVALAAAGLALKHPAATDRARELLTRELTSTTNLASRWWRSRGPGGQDGVGGMLFGWAMASRLLPDLEAPVGKAVARMLAQRVEPQPAADLLSGSLGLVAGLVAARGAGIPVDQGIAQAIVATTETAVREYLTQRGVNGFSHGNSGMAAVLDAAGVAGWASDESLVTRCLDAESRRFDTALGDWHDLRRGPDAGPGPGWCNGAAGLALARLSVRGPDEGPAAPAALGDPGRSGPGQPVLRQHGTRRDPAHLDDGGSHHEGHLRSLREWCDRASER
ncbi:MAG: lanthionine synthetase LanC family protein [Candidatus Nanopelagicales bacterium]